MIKGIKNPYFHILFWSGTTGLLILVFGRSWSNPIAATFYITLLLPVVMGTAYFFNYYLVPLYLLRKKYFLFSLYFFYTLVVSLYLEMIVIFVGFSYFANFDFSGINPNAMDMLLLATIMYLIVFAGSLGVMLQQIQENQQKINELISEQLKTRKGYLEITSNRKVLQLNYNDIIYIESLSDYVKIMLENREPVTTKERISNMEKILPDAFIRIHRSFIVNRTKINHFNSSEVEIANQLLNFGRSFKTLALKKLRESSIETK